MAAIHSEWIGGDHNYDLSGRGYPNYRRADPRIAALIHSALGDAKTVLNIGAGSGNYEPEDRYVIAIEPSVVMRAQRPKHLVPAIHGAAESLPLDDASVDASMAILTIHQWGDLERGLRELRRVTRGPIVIMTFDPSALNRLWLSHYIPEFHLIEGKRFRPIDEICGLLAENTSVSTIPIPLDCVDGFTEAYYGRPEAFLDPAVRKSQSAWSFMDPPIVRNGIDLLFKDIESGHWDRMFGHLRTQPFFEGALRLIIRH